MLAKLDKKKNYTNKILIISKKIKKQHENYLSLFMQMKIHAAQKLSMCSTLQFGDFGDKNN